MKKILNEWRKYLEEDQRGNMKKMLNLPEFLVEFFHNEFGGKNAFLVAKWWIEYAFRSHLELNGGNVKYPDKHPFSDRIWVAVEDIDLIGKLLKIDDISERISEYVQNDEYEFLRNYYGDSLKRELDDDVKLQYKLGESRHILEYDNLDFFLKVDIIRSIKEGKLQDVGPYKNLTFDEARNKYADKRIPELKVVKQYSDGMKWVDVEARRCQIVGMKMKNCGSTGFHSRDEDSTMLLLMDKNNNPHVVVTWEPNDRRLSYPEGQAGSLPKEKYWGKIKDLLSLYPVKKVEHGNIYSYDTEKEKMRFEKYVSV